MINASNLDTVKSAQSKQSTKHKHNIYNKLTTKQKKIYVYTSKTRKLSQNRQCSITI